MTNHLRGTSDTQPGLPRRIGQDLYQQLMTASWPPEFASFAAFFLSFNLAFAALYGLHRAPAPPISIRRAIGSLLLFGVETLATWPRRRRGADLDPKMLCNRNKRPSKWPQNRLSVPFRALLLAE